MKKKEQENKGATSEAEGDEDGVGESNKGEEDILADDKKEVLDQKKACNCDKEGTDDEGVGLTVGAKGKMVS